jgi:hypothetical protein
MLGLSRWEYGMIFSYSSTMNLCGGVLKKLNVESPNVNAK